jgi:hypothetical protein
VDVVTIFGRVVGRCVGSNVMASEGDNEDDVVVGDTVRSGEMDDKGVGKFVVIFDPLVGVGIRVGCSVPINVGVAVGFLLGVGDGRVIGDEVVASDGDSVRFGESDEFVGTSDGNNSDGTDD